MSTLDLEKEEELVVKLPASVELERKQENFRKTSISVSSTILKPLTAWIMANCGKLLERDKILTHLTCLLRNLYAGQEATVRTLYGTTDWLKIKKGVGQGCLLSRCLFNRVGTS